MMILYCNNERCNTDSLLACILSWCTGNTPIGPFGPIVGTIPEVVSAVVTLDVPLGVWGDDNLCDVVWEYHILGFDAVNTTHPMLHTPALEEAVYSISVRVYAAEQASEVWETSMKVRCDC